MDVSTVQVGHGRAEYERDHAVVLMTNTTVADWSSAQAPG